ncbi:MAG: hypothetical protein WCN92_01565 [Eubacteriales bacterium]
MKIVYRLVTALLALCVIPASYFLSFLKYGINAVVINIGDDISLKILYDQLINKTSPLNTLFSGTGASEFFTNASIKSLMPAAICFLVFFAIAIILSLVIFFFAVFSKKLIVITSLGGAGLLSIIGAYISFGRLASPLTSGAIKINDFVDKSKIGALLNIVVGLVGSAIKIEVLKLTSATLIMALIFASIIIWGLAFIVTDDGSDKRAAKLAKLAKLEKKQNRARKKASNQ